MSTVRIDRTKIKFRGQQFHSDTDAIKYATENKMRAIKVDGGHYAVTPETADDLRQMKQVEYLTS